MSSNWIKMSVGLRTHPKVVRMASALKADRLRVIGGLWAVWCVFDAHSSDGLLEGYNFAILDEELAWRGFAKAMASVEWLIEHEDGGLEVPRFEEHNGPTAKRRAMETDRKRAERNADKVGTKPGQTSASNADTMRTREEKRREEKEIPPEAPKGARSPVVGLKAWLETVKASGEKPIPSGDAVFAYAEEVQLPSDFLHLAWLEFRHRYGQPDAKRYRDWRAVFRRAVRGNWLKLWWLDGKEFSLTTVGLQAQRAHQEKAA